MLSVLKTVVPGLLVMLTPGLPVELATAAVPVNVTVPVRVPLAVGVNVTLIEQLLPAPRDAVQVVVRAKSPLMLMLDSATEPEPVFVTVMGCAALLAPIA